MLRSLVRFSASAAMLFLGGCASQRAAIPPDVIPPHQSVSAEDEAYGHEVFAGLSDQYPLDTNDANINRVRDVVDRLTRAIHADREPWHVYVLKGDNFGNAAATRGNFIFVWTGMLNAVRSDGELAAVLAHEIGHVLAGHTAPDPAEEIDSIIAGVAGTAVGTIVQNTQFGAASQIAEALVRASLEAMLTNPGSQSKELEADQIGMQLMAQAKYDPQQAIDFWERVKNDPKFSGGIIEFFSSHPSSDRRVENLRLNADSARARYQAAKSGHPLPMDPRALASAGGPPLPDRRAQPRDPPRRLPDVPVTSTEWQVQVSKSAVRDGPGEKSRINAYLGRDDIVTVQRIEGRWLKIIEPYEGYVKSSEAAPMK